MWKENEKPNIQSGALPVITAQTFTMEVLTSKQPVLVEFTSPWSRPCQVSDSVLQEIARECAGKITVLKVNADDSLDLSLGYDIRFVPTLLYFVGGKLRERIVGTASKEAILAKLKPLTV
jgi:thioredoxin 1